METRNVTLTIPKTLLQHVKVLAARRGTSISKLLTTLLSEAVEREDEYGAAQRRALAKLEQGFDLGTCGALRASRDALHER